MGPSLFISQPTVKGLGMCGITLTGFKRLFVVLFPRLSLRSNLGLKLANAFGVFQTESPPIISAAPLPQNKIYSYGDSLPHK
jgi:hypothetical protein